jgi:membrane-associated protease RseP (regulator of RpoE activity)
VSSNLPQFPTESSPPEGINHGNYVYLQDLNPSRNEWIISGVLFLTTLFCTTLAGLFLGSWDLDYLAGLRAILHEPRLLVHGLSFSVSLLSILLAHELGHFFACRFYGMRCTPPFFLPIPISAGTLGAFIKIKSPFPNRRALFDVGVAGPLAGFFILVPILWIGIKFSTLLPKGALPTGGMYLGEPLIFRFLGRILLGYSPSHQEIMAHPMAMAAWVGLLATSLNLMPIWQLDGGHIAYAIWGRGPHKKISIVGISTLMVLGLLGWPVPSYFVLGSLLLIIGIRLRLYHPPPQFEEDSIGNGRLLLGLLSIIILIACFIPIPVTIR